jgi:protocatechuate 3,4-dioxygenase beta subunit
MAFPTRRRFLTELAALGAVVATGRLDAQQRGLDQFVIPTLPCTEADLTPAVPDATGFKPGSPARTSIAEAGAQAARIVLTGHVIGIKCGKVKGAQLDFWQTDPAGAYDMKGFRFRGHQVTDAEARYKLETVMPGAEATRAPRLGVRVTAPGQSPLTTLLFFPDEPRNARDAQFAPKLLMKRGASGGSFTFDFILNL